jgi:Deoxyribonuclease II
VDAKLLLMYNDELPNGTTSQSAAHAKGVVAFDRSAGFWMLHSVPRYPPDSGATYSYPVTGFKYGQTVLCLTLPFSSANEIGNHRINFRLEFRGSSGQWRDELIASQVHAIESNFPGNSAKIFTEPCPYGADPLISRLAVSVRPEGARIKVASDSIMQIGRFL